MADFAEFLNLLDSRDHDIDYAYTSRTRQHQRQRSQMFSTPSNRFKCGWDDRAV